MTKIAVVTLLALALLLVPAPVVSDEALAADAAAADSGQGPDAKEEDLEEFVPSQKVSADASVSFPVDI